MSNVTCPLLASESTKLLISNLASVSLFVIKPICLFFDFFGHLLCFIAFYKQSRTSQIYAFQLYEAVAKAVASVVSGLKLIFYNWMSGANNSAGVASFRRSYFLMWCAAHLAIPLDDAATTIVLFLSVATSVDRAYAIGHPTRYKSINRKSWESIAVTISVLISVACCIFASFLYTLEGGTSDNDLYKVISNAAFQANPLSPAFSHLRNAVWVFGLLSLMISGFCLVYFYQSRQREVAQLTGQNETNKGKTRRQSEKALFILTVYQILQEINQIGIMIIHTMFALKPGFQACEGLLFSAVRTLETSIVNASDFYIMLLVSTAFRKIIKEALSTKKQNEKITSTAIVTKQVKPAQDK